MTLLKLLTVWKPAYMQVLWLNNVAESKYKQSDESWAEDFKSSKKLKIV